MSDSVLDHCLPWSAEEYLALGETMSRVDLIEGSLWSGPRGEAPHQAVVGSLVSAMHPAAGAAGLHALHYINVALGPDTILAPDLVVASYPSVAAADPGPASFADFGFEAADVTLVGEVISASTVAVDRVLRMHLYAAAAIPWYLLVEPTLPAFESVRLRLFRLKGSRYVEAVVAVHGQTLTTRQPFPFAIDTVGLLPRQPS